MLSPLQAYDTRDAVPVSELAALKFENILLKLQLLDQQFKNLQLQAKALQEVQNNLLEEMRLEAGVGPTSTYDPQTRKFKV